MEYDTTRCPTKWSQWKQEGKEPHFHSEPPQPCGSVKVRVRRSEWWEGQVVFGPSCCAHVQYWSWYQVVSSLHIDWNSSDLAALDEVLWEVSTLQTGQIIRQQDFNGTKMCKLLTSRSSCSSSLSARLYKKQTIQSTAAFIHIHSRVSRLHIQQLRVFEAFWVKRLFRTLTPRKAKCFWCSRRVLARFRPLALLSSLFSQEMES